MSIDTICTSTKVKNISSDNSTPCTITQTFFPNQSFCFTANLQSLNQTRIDLGISPILFNKYDYVLVVFVCENIIENNFNPLFTFYKNLNNKIEDIIFEELSEVKQKINQEYLYDIMNLQEKIKISKDFVFIFRIVRSDSLSTSLQLNLLDYDIINDVTFIMNANEQGPFSVKCDTLDLINPQDFDQQEIQTIYDENISLMSYEGLRVFYPEDLKNITQIPIIVCVHANGASEDNYDEYLSKYASYGFFCCSVSFDSNVYYADLYGPYSDINSQIAFKILSTINHIKKYKSKIKNGFLLNFVDFNNIILMGHSRGGGAVVYCCQYLKYATVSSEFSELNYSDVKALVVLSPFFTTGIDANGNLLQYTIASSSLTTTADVDKYRLGLGDIPSFSVFPLKDDDTSIEMFLVHSGLSVDSLGDVESDKVILLMKESKHQTLGDQYNKENLRMDYWTSAPPINQLSTNTTVPIRSIISFESLLFLKKILHNTKTDKLYNLNLAEPYKSQYNNFYTYTENFSKQKVYSYIDQFNGNLLHNLEYNFLLENISFDYSSGLDITFEQLLANLGNSTNIDNYIIQSYSNGLFRVVSFSLIVDYRSIGIDDPFNQIMLTRNGAVRIEINESNSDYYMRYNLSNVLNLNDCSSILISGCQVANTENFNNAHDVHFSVSITDVSGNTAILNTENYGEGLLRPLKGGDSFYFVGMQNIVIPIKDFQLKYPDISMDKINTIELKFGSDWGTSKGEIVLDEISLLK